MVAIGNTIGGHFSNQQPLKSLSLMFGLLSLSLVFLFVAILSDQLILATLATLVLGLFSFMNVPGLQLYVVQLAEEYTPKDITLASAFNISAFNIGIAFGSFAGGRVVDSSGLYTNLHIAAALTAIGLFIAMLVQVRANPKLLKN